MLRMICILEVSEEGLNLRQMVYHVIPLILELVDKRLILFDVALFVKAELGHILHTHFIDGIQLRRVSMRRLKTNRRGARKARRWYKRLGR